MHLDIFELLQFGLSTDDTYFENICQKTAQIKLQLTKEILLYTKPEFSIAKNASPNNGLFIFLIVTVYINRKTITNRKNIFFWL